MKPLQLMIFASAFLISNCQKTVTFDLAEETSRVEQTIHTSIAWAKNKDLKALYRVIAQDSSYVEVDPGQRIVHGFTDFQKAEAFWMNSDFKAVRYDIHDLHIQFSKNGDVAWFFGILDDINEWKGQPANWENTRWTGVLEKRNDEWVIVQMHFSFSQD